MQINNLDLKKIYYYVICTMAFFVLMWGVIDAASASIGILNINSSTGSFTAPNEEAPLATEKGDQFFDLYYQRKMLYDRLWDSLARALIASAIFAYHRYTANKLGQQA